jgi:hypothetical protein
LLRLESLDRLLEVVRDTTGKLGDADVADIIPFYLLAHCADLDDLAHQREIERRVLALAHDLQPNLGAGGAPHLFYRLGQGHAFDRRAVDLVDDVARQNSGPRGRRIVNRRHHLEDAVLHVDLHAKTAELAAGCRLHVAIALRIHVARMRIERLDDSVNRCGKELFVVRLVDIV